MFNPSELQRRFKEIGEKYGLKLCFCMVRMQQGKERKDSDMDVAVLGKDLITKLFQKSIPIWRVS